MAHEAAGMVLHEHVVLHKFEGDDQTRPPLGTIVLDDGAVTSRCDSHDWRRLTGNAPLVCGHCGEVFDGSD